jgi:hypothetical protein
MKHMFIEILVSAIAGYIVWRQETIEREIRLIDARLDKLEAILPRRKDDVY